MPAAKESAKESISGSPSHHQDGFDSPVVIPVDHGETVSLMEPLLLPTASKVRGRLADRAVSIIEKSAGFERSLPREIVQVVSDLVRAMNCYYSNLIEGHNTHPIDIEKALGKDFSEDPYQRDLQEEAKAHIDVQAWIDTRDTLVSPVSTEFLQSVHRRFCEALPPSLLTVPSPDGADAVTVIPGAFRDHFAKVGRHVAISPGAVPRFSKRFETVFGGLDRFESVLTLAASHHRFLWIHPFSDGNGRTARLMSHAILKNVGNSAGLWSISRGLARNVAAYKAHLAACDSGRRTDLDGRGTLSLEALEAFSEFFLDICLDQIDFMESLIQPDTLRKRILAWCEAETAAGRLDGQAAPIMQAILFRGSLSRDEAAQIIGRSHRTTRRITSHLQALGALSSDNKHAPLRLGMPVSLAEKWLPGLFPAL